MANSQTQSGLAAIGKELSQNPPSIVNATKRKYGPDRALAQTRAIMFSKARKAGLNVPANPKGRLTPR